MSFTQDGSAGDFTVNLGSTVEIPIYLSGDSRLSTQGLFSAGATVSYAYGSGVGSISSGNASIRSAQVDPQWTSSLNYVEVNTALDSQYAILEGVVAGPPVVPVKPSVGTNYVKIGTVMFDAGSVGNETLLSLSTDLNLAFINLLHNTSSGDPLDGQITFIGGRVLTITATPEPSSLGILALVGAAYARMRRRRQRATLSV